MYKHVIILNCDKTIEKVKNFKQLKKYKEEHPEAFVLAPHPTFSRFVSMGARNLKKHIHLFDAVEYSWLYSEGLNANRKAEVIAAQYNKPMIATADVHFLKKLDMDHALIDVDELSVDAVFKAITAGRFQNVTAPKRFRDLVIYLVRTFAKYAAGYVKIYVFGFEFKHR